MYSISLARIERRDDDDDDNDVRNVVDMLNPRARFACNEIYEGRKFIGIAYERTRSDIYGFFITGPWR